METPSAAGPATGLPGVGNQVPRYSGWKQKSVDGDRSTCVVGNQVPRYSGWKRCVFLGRWCDEWLLETKYRDIADGNGIKDLTRINPMGLETKYRDIADGNVLALQAARLRKMLLETKYRDIADGNAK